MNYNTDKRVVMTLDAGGTNFVFSAMQSGKAIVEPIRYPSNGNNLDLCLNTIVKGFKEVAKVLPSDPVAISFAFPGPADYPNGIIGDLPNLKGFRGGVALGPMLHEIFGLPVFINNDGDLFAYGEFIGGLLPWVNEKLRLSGSPKQYKNLIGVTLGTGFGAGIVRNGELFAGDNSNSGEVWLMRHGTINRCFVEEGISIRAVQRIYKEHAAGKVSDNLTPKDIYDIAVGKHNGDKEAALRAFEEMAIVLADALANVNTIIDGLIVIGGGLSASFDLIIDRVLKDLNGEIESYSGQKIARLSQKTYNLHDNKQLNLFLAGQKQEIVIPGTTKKLAYDPEKRTGIGLTPLGTSEAINLGAYAYALHELDKS